MNHRMYASAALVLSLVAGCTPAVPKPVELKRLGAACTANADCGSDFCDHAACTRPCASQGECPYGFDCTRQGPEDLGATCVVTVHDSTNPGGFGTSCSASAVGCGGENPCVSGFVCNATLACEGGAYCTKACTRDLECPPSMLCGNPATGPRQCVKRPFCAPCDVDDQCGPGNLCATDLDGGRFCAKTCGSAGDCRKPSKNTDTGENAALPFEQCLADLGGKGTVCQPTSQRCHGLSVLPAFPGTGQICSGCRAGVPGDCADGHVCHEEEAGERWCSKECTVDLRLGNGSYSLSNDSCPTGTKCFFGGGVSEACGNACTAKGVCGADPSYRIGTCYPLPAE